jgi:hypothetical protein
MVRKTDSPKYVFASQTCAAPADDHGGFVWLSVGECWDPMDPLVLRNGGLFSSTPPAGFPRRSVRTEADAAARADLEATWTVPA